MLSASVFLMLFFNLGSTVDFPLASEGEMLRVTLHLPQGLQQFVNSEQWNTLCSDLTWQPTAGSDVVRAAQGALCPWSFAPTHLSEPGITLLPLHV